jgi:tetratricopeptide (TPR) repeat protein
MDLHVPLGDLLDQIDAQLGKLGQGMQVDLESLLLNIDQANERIKMLEKQDRDLKAEKTQFGYIITTIQENASGFIRELGGKRTYQALRSKHNPGIEQKWWYLDDYLKQKRQKLIKNSAFIAAISIISIIIMVIIYQTFLAPDPQFIERIGYTQDAQRFLLDQNYTKALDKVNQALILLPEDPELLTLRGVIYQSLKQDVLAVDDYIKAESLFNDQETFLLTRSMDYLQANQPEYSLNDSRAVIQTNPQSAEGYFYLGKGYELKGDFLTAIEDYGIAARLAQEQNKAELAATIKMNMAMLYQSLGNQIPTPMESPTP